MIDLVLLHVIHIYQSIEGKNEREMESEWLCGESRSHKPIFYKCEASIHSRSYIEYVWANKSQQFVILASNTPILHDNTISPMPFKHKPSTDCLIDDWSWALHQFPKHFIKRPLCKYLLTWKLIIYLTRFELSRILFK